MLHRRSMALHLANQRVGVTELLEKYLDCEPFSMRGPAFPCFSLVLCMTDS
jgi:hypothetical protein